MNPLPKPISQFLKEKHIVSFTAHYQEDFWPANCFYAFDEQKVRLIVMTKTTTRHAQLMLKNDHIVGTIAGQPNKIKDMEGIQFTALAHLLENQEERKRAFEIYIKKQPLAKLVNSDIWEIQEVFYFLPFETALFVVLVFTKSNEYMQFGVMEVLLKDIVFEVITQLNIR